MSSQHPEQPTPEERGRPADAEPSAPMPASADEPQAAPSPPPTARFDWRATLRDIGKSMFSGARGALGDLRAAVGHVNPRGLLLGIVGLVAAAYLASGIYVVAPGEAAVVRRFGAVVEPRVGPGLHYRVPWPIDRVDLIDVSTVRRETVGVAAPEDDHEHPEPPARLQALSGDTNVIDIEIVVQYQVRDPAAYLVNVRYAPYRLVRDAVRAAVTSQVTTLPVDDILTTERQALQQAIRTDVQERLDAYNAGLAVVGVNLQKAFPPDDVAAAFTDVNSAREDRARAINEAQGYANSLIPQARGEAEQIGAAAQAYRSDALGQANGGAQAFTALLGEYETNARIYGKDITRYRLYLETLDQIMQRAQVYVVDIRNGGTVNLRLFGNQAAPATPVPAGPQPTP